MRIAMRLVADAYDALARGDAGPLLVLIPAGIEWRIVGPASRPHGIVCRTPVDVQKYFGDLFSSERITSFEPDDFIDMGEQIVVIGFVASATESTGELFKSEWVHVFDVKDGLRTRWSDFLDSSVPIALDVLPLANSALSPGQGRLEQSLARGHQLLQWGNESAVAAGFPHLRGPDVVY